MDSLLSGRNKIIAVNTWTISLIRYGAAIMKWTKNKLYETKTLGKRKSKKMITLNKKNYSRSGRGRGLIGCKMYVKAEKDSLGWCFKHKMEVFIVAVRNSYT